MEPLDTVSHLVVQDDRPVQDSSTARHPQSLGKTRHGRIHRARDAAAAAPDPSRSASRHTPEITPDFVHLRN